MKRDLLTSFTCALLASTALGCASAAAATCASLTGLILPVSNTTITIQSIPAGTYTAPDGEVLPNLTGLLSRGRRVEAAAYIGYRL